MLDYGRIFTHSAALLWQQRRAIWPVLLLYGLSGLALGLLNFWLAFDTRLAVLAEPDLLIEHLMGMEPLAPARIWPWFTAVLTIAFFYWLLITFAEGGLVGAVLSSSQQPGERLTKAAVFRWGRRLLWRFLAIDAIIFIPPFLLLLLALIIPSATLLSAAALDPQTVTYELLAFMLLVGVSCACLLLCLALPLLPLTLLWRTLALRETAVASLTEQGALPTVRAAIRQSLQTARSHPTEILILALLLWGGVLTAHLLLSTLSWPLLALLTTLPVSQSAPLGLLLTLLRAIPQALVQTYFIIAWTVAYMTLTEQGRSEK
jgi:hypothetical protein